MSLPMDTNKLEASKRTSIFAKRHLIVLMATMAPLVCYISRQNLSMAIVAMIDDHNQSGPVDRSNMANTTLALRETNYNNCPRPELIRDEHGNMGDSYRYGPRYKWTPAQKSLIFEAFFWTYFAGQVPGARFAEVVGAKWAMALATVGSSVLSALTPWAASVSVYALATLRALLGVCQAALFPALYVLYSRWLPPLERSRALSVIGVGAYLGAITASTSAGYFIQQRHFGWEYAFYMASIICALWSIIWMFVGASEPALDGHIQQEELEYIESKMEPANRQSTNRRNNISWSKVLGSRAVWAFMAANWANDWPSATLNILLPTYLNDILHITPLINGMINSTMYVIYCACSPIVGFVSAHMVANRSCQLTSLSVRKLFEGIALYGMALCFVVLPMFGCHMSFVLGNLFLLKVLSSFAIGGEAQMPSEMSVDFTGTIYAMGNCAATTTGFIVPRVHSLIVTNSYDRHQWELYFYLSALVVSLGSLWFSIFGANHLEDYSDHSKEQEVEEAL